MSDRKKVENRYCVRFEENLHFKFHFKVIPCGVLNNPLHQMSLTSHSFHSNKIAPWDKSWKKKISMRSKKERNSLFKILGKYTTIPTVNCLKADGIPTCPPQ